VSASTALTDDDLARYARHIVLKELGGSGQRELLRASVVVIGAGGIGSPAIQYLAGAGIGRLTIVDDDAVELSNLQRQTIFAAGDLGRPKAQAASERAQAINATVEARAMSLRVTGDNARDLIAGADVVLDGCDNFATRLAVADAALALRVPLVSAAVGQFEGQLAVYRGWEPHLPCYRCFVGPSPERAELNCAEAGILGPVTGVIGSLAALEVIRAVAPFGTDPAGTILLADLLSLRFRTLRLPPDPACAACGSGE